MPVYEYRCDSCSKQFELRQKFSDPPVDRCPECGGTVRKLVSAVSFSLKGAGWFGDGYGAKVEPTAESDSAASTGTAIEGVSADSTPAETSSETQASVPTQTEKKSTAEEKPVKDTSESNSTVD